ncbi:MAG: Qat anti-phage system associated protein QatB [Gemmatimonadota bacterium]
MGGSHRAAQASPAGQKTAAGLAGFLSGVATRGIVDAARVLGIGEFLDRSADVFLLHLADALAPAGALTEDSVARDAMDDTLQELFDRLDIANEGAQALEHLTPSMMADALVRYVINYIYTRVINALTAHIHAKAGVVGRMRDIERTARHYIEDAVRLDIDTTAFFGPDGAAFAAQWDAGVGQRVINRLFEESYGVVQAGLQHGDRREE